MIVSFGGLLPELQPIKSRIHLFSFHSFCQSLKALISFTSLVDLAEATALCDFIRGTVERFYVVVFTCLRYNKVGSEGGKYREPRTDR